MTNNIYVNCYYYGFYTSQENLIKFNLSSEKLTKSHKKISHYFNEKKNFKKVQSLTKELEHLENLNLESNNNELINYNFSNISKKIAEKLYNYDYNKIYYIFC